MPKKSDSDPSATASGGSENRYRQLEEMLELAIELQGSHRGLTYAQISERWGCSSKTAKRRVKALRSVFGDSLVAERQADNANLRFRLRHRLVSDAAAFTASELAGLEEALQLALETGRDQLAATLVRAVEKARALTESRSL